MTIEHANWKSNKYIKTDQSCRSNWAHIKAGNSKPKSEMSKQPSWEQENMKSPMPNPLIDV